MIEIRDLSCTFPDGTVALERLSLTIADGEFLLLCGPNGSGKTTLIRHLNGLLRPTSGSVTVDGFDTVREPRRVLERVGMVFQDADSQIVGETVEEDVAFGPENLGLPADEVAARVRSALATVGAERLAERPCHLLSGGEKRRVAIAGVLAIRPRVLVFDEPFANLDYPGIRQVLQQIVMLHRQGHTIVLSTHDLEKVVAHADRIAILSQGTLKELGPPEEILPRVSVYAMRPPCHTLLGKKVISWLED